MDLNPFASFLRGSDVPLRQPWNIFLMNVSSDEWFYFIFHSFQPGDFFSLNPNKKQVNVLWFDFNWTRWWCCCCCCCCCCCQALDCGNKTFELRKQQPIESFGKWRQRWWERDGRSRVRIPVSAKRLLRRLRWWPATLCLSCCPLNQSGDFKYM